MKNSYIGVWLAFSLTAPSALPAIAQTQPRETPVAGTIAIDDPALVQAAKSDPVTQQLIKYNKGYGYSSFPGIVRYAGLGLIDKTTNAAKIVDLDCGWGIAKGKQKLNDFYSYTEELSVAAVGNKRIWSLDDNIIAVRTIGTTSSYEVVEAQIFDLKSKTTKAKQCNFGGAEPGAFLNCTPIAEFADLAKILPAHTFHQQQCKDLWNGPYPRDGVPMKNVASADGYYNPKARAQFFAGLRKEINTLKQ